MDMNELKTILQAKCVTIVHFSHCAEIRSGVVFPDDLRNAIANQSEGGPLAWRLSCSALTPGHQMELVGDVGIILEPVDVENILKVCENDAGSSDFGSFGTALTRDSLERSLNPRPGSYNEWEVRGMKPVGIFVSQEDFVRVKRPHKLSGFDVIGETIISVDSVHAEFPHLPVFTMGPTGLRQLR